MIVKIKPVDGRALVTIAGRGGKGRETRPREKLPVNLKQLLMSGIKQIFVEASTDPKADHWILSTVVLPEQEW